MRIDRKSAYRFFSLVYAVFKMMYAVYAVYTVVFFSIWKTSFLYFKITF